MICKKSTNLSRNSTGTCSLNVIFNSINPPLQFLKFFNSGNLDFLEISLSVVTQKRYKIDHRQKIYIYLNF